VTSSTLPILAPSATVGILGGGQLGRMLAMAAAKLGLRCQVFCPTADAPACQVVAHSLKADYTDTAALEAFAHSTDVITYEFENVPAAAAAFLAARRPVLPDPEVLATTQDRLVEKTFLAASQIATAPFAPVDGPADLERALTTIGRPAVLKTRRFGYDGKGQCAIGPGTDLDEAWNAVGCQPSIVEAYVEFEREISVVTARGHDGQVMCFDVTENEHRNHILKISRVPASISPAVDSEARRIAETIAAAFEYVGVLAVEMFVVREAAGHAVLVNEIAPRVHNSGHWTLDGASVSQFEQHIRAIAGWPLANPERYGRVEMINLIGAEVSEYRQWLAVPGASVHLYGKHGVRAGRKMGHVTRVFIEGGRP